MTIEQFLIEELTRQRDILVKAVKNALEKCNESRTPKQNDPTGLSPSLAAALANSEPPENWEETVKLLHSEAYESLTRLNSKIDNSVLKTPETDTSMIIQMVICYRDCQFPKPYWDVEVIGGINKEHWEFGGKTPLDVLNQALPHLYRLVTKPTPHELITAELALSELKEMNRVKPENLNL